MFYFTFKLVLSIMFASHLFGVGFRVYIICRFLLMIKPFNTFTNYEGSRSVLLNTYEQFNICDLDCTCILL